MTSTMKRAMAIIRRARVYAIATVDTRHRKTKRRASAANWENLAMITPTLCGGHKSAMSVSTYIVHIGSVAQSLLARHRYVANIIRFKNIF